VIEMPAGLATKTNGQTALWLNGKPGWHNLGRVWNVEVDGAPTFETVMQESGLDFEVEKRPMFYGATTDSKMGTALVDRGQNWAIVRNDTEQQLGTVGNVYEPFNNRQAFSFLEEVTGQGAGYLESAGLLARGAQAFVTMVLGEDIVIDGQGIADRVKKYVLVTTRHDGNGKVTGAVTPTRVVCTNTLTWGLSRAQTRIDVKHTKGGIDRLKEASRVLKLATVAYDEFEADANALFGEKMTKRQFEAFLKEVAFPIKATDSDLIQQRAINNRNRALTIWTEAKTMEGVRGTRWGAAQALTEQIDHFSDVRVAKSLLLAESTPKTVAQDIAKGARIVNGATDERKTQLHKALLTWKR
jgi:phage/plasmid-like protein (TIGR03299 family)